MSLAKQTSQILEFPGLAKPRSAVSRPERIEPQATDQELVDRLAAGDPWAKEALYHRYVGMVWGTALRLMGHSADAEDVLQDAFIEALRDVPHLLNAAALRSWLLKITVHQAHRRFRRRSVLRKLGIDQGVADATLSLLVHPGASPETHAELARVDRALRQVSTAERFAWMLRYVEGHSLEEVADACACSLPTIKRRISKANARIQRHLRPGGLHV